MGQQELEAALRQEGEVQAREIWRAAELEAQRLRDATAQQIRSFEENDRLQRAAQRARRFEEAEVAAQQRARKLCLTTEARLAERLWRLADRLLRQLAERKREELFAALVAELPPLAWRLVRVAPEDLELARQHFPEAEIVAASRIRGGLEVEDEERWMIIVNTLEKRLEHLWPDLLPLLLGELRQLMETDGTAAEL